VSEHRQKNADKPQWTNVEFLLPAPFAERLNEAYLAQAKMENRPISVSEFGMWILTLGMQARAQLLAKDEEEQRLVKLPGEVRRRR